MTRNEIEREALYAAFLVDDNYCIFYEAPDFALRRRLPAGTALTMQAGLVEDCKAACRDVARLARLARREAPLAEPYVIDVLRIMRKRTRKLGRILAALRRTA